MQDKVTELAEWVAKTILEADIYRRPLPTSNWQDVAKQILSHPDLALIDRGKELPLPRSPISIDPHPDYYVAQQDMLGENYKPVIPLAEALKEMEDMEREILMPYSDSIERKE